MFHPARVAAWLSGTPIVPLYVEISPSGGCNHRCVFCALDYLGYQKRFLDSEILKQRLTEMAWDGVKAVMFAGEGEPLLHKGLADIIVHGKQAGLDLAVTTNASALTKRFVDKALPALSWLRASINAGTAATYWTIHGANDFPKVMKNLAYAVGKGTTIGAQLVLLPENRHEVVALAQRVKDMGLNYLIVKPYSQHPLSRTRRYADIQYGVYRPLREELAELNGDGFEVIFRQETMESWDGQEAPAVCHALPFWGYIDSGGDVWSCSVHMGEEAYRLGNINKSSISWRAESMSVSGCRVNCRMAKVIRYLDGLKNPSPHVNFI